MKIPINFTKNGILWLIAAVVVIGIMAFALPGGYDYETTYFPTAQRLAQGETRLYDSASRGYYNAPWLMLLILPTLPFGLTGGFIVFTIFSLAGIAYAVQTSSRLLPTKPSQTAIILAVVSWHTFSLLFLGQVDVVGLVGVVLGWRSVQSRRPFGLGAAFVLLGTKPLNVALAGLLFLLSIRRWPRQEIIKVFVLPVVFLLGAHMIFGWDWMLRYINNLGVDAPDALYIASIWQGAALLGIPNILVAVAAGFGLAYFLRTAWWEGLNYFTLGLGLALNLLFSPYAYIHHYVTLIPISLGLTPRWRWAAYAFTWLIVPRTLLGPEASALDVLYPLILLIALHRQPKPNHTGAQTSSFVQ